MGIIQDLACCLINFRLKSSDHKLQFLGRRLISWSVCVWVQTIGANGLHLICIHLFLSAWLLFIKDLLAWSILMKGDNQDENGPIVVASLKRINSSIIMRIQLWGKNQFWQNCTKLIVASEDVQPQRSYLIADGTNCLTLPISSSENWTVMNISILMEEQGSS